MVANLKETVKLGISVESEVISQKLEKITFIR